MGDKNQLIIFDIDSVLDKLEDEIINQESFSSASQSQQQKNESINIPHQNFYNQHENIDVEEKNGNITTSNSSKINDQSLSENNNEDLSKTQSSFDITLRDDSLQSQTTEDTSRPNFNENSLSVTIDEKFINTSSSTETNSSETSSDNSSSDDIKQSDQIPLQVSSLIDTDNSSKQLISDESHKPDVEDEEEEEDNEEVLEIDDDQDLPVTSDLTLTKTVEPTEYDPEPEFLEINEPLEKEEAGKLASNNNENDSIKIKEPTIEEKVVDEHVYIKEMSHNFESTMDDISDAELESLEQELEDLVAATDNHENVYVDSLIKTLQESIDKTVEVELKKDEAEAVETKQNEVVVSDTLENKIEDSKVEMIEKDEEEEPPKEICSIKLNANEEEDGAKVLESNESVEVIEQEREEESLISEVSQAEQVESVSEAQEATEPDLQNLNASEAIDQDGALSTSSTDESASIQNLPSQSNEDFSVNESNSTGSLTSQPDLGRVPPYWIPDSMTNQCMHCDQKFSLIKRRHHCRACGLLLCSNCCNEKFFLHYLQAEGRICQPCHEILLKAQQQQQHEQQPKNPNPANPSEYCSKIPVQEQASASSHPPPTVMVPGVLKRSSGSRSSERKSVIFSDGIRPGTDLDETFNTSTSRATSVDKSKFNLPILNEKNNSFIPEPANDLPPILLKDSEYKYVDNNLTLLTRLRQEELKFAINKNFYVTVKIVTLICCTNKTVINFSTSGLLAVRQDEIMILLELNDDMVRLSKEIFLHLNEIYSKADKSNVIIKEYGYSSASTNKFLGAFGGFLYIKPTFQCLQSLTLPENPYLIATLVHKWEVPWMRLFPLRLILRLGALYRYYPTPILSNVNREPVFAEIGNTIMNFLVDFRNFSYTIEIIKGLNIHMEEGKTSVFIPRNRYDQIMKVINNSTDHLLAFGADFSRKADGHLVCIQNIDSGSSESLSYSTQAINIQGQNRIRTGASFLILNGALKQSSGLKGKCSIVEDGLMIQIFATKMQNVRDALKNMKNIEIPCGPIDDEQKEAEEVVSIEWVDDDLSFNIGVTSPIDDLSFEGKESIRTRLDITSQSHTKTLRWCEVFLLESDEAPVTDDHLNYSRVCEPIAKACGNALLPFLDLMAVNQLRKIGIRVTLGENIKYLAGSNKLLFSPIYMNALDNELIGVIHRQASNLSRDSNITMELIFYILNK